MSARRVYKKVREGNGQVDMLNDNIAMVGFARTYSTYAAQVRPGGQAIDEPFLVRVESEATSLLKILGQAEAGSDDVTRKVDRQNRLLTLCVMAERDIKDFAEAAFFDNPKRYNRDYTRTRPGPASGTPPTTPPADPTAPA